MTVTAVAGLNLWDSAYFPANLSTEPRARLSGTMVEGTSASMRPASAQAVPIQFGNDSYTSGVRAGAQGSVQAPSSTASNALSLTGLMGSNSTVDSQGAPLLNGTPLSLLGGVSSAASSGAGQGSGSAQAGAPSIANGEILSQLNAAISAAAADGSQDSNWMDDLVSYASGLGGGTSASSGGTGTGALSSDLSAIENVIQKVASHVSSALAAQGASPSLMSAAVNALTTSLTLNSLSAVAQQIAAKTGNPNTFTVTSSVVTITANGAGTNASVAGETESFSGASNSLALSTTGGNASVAAGSDAAGNGTSLNAGGFGYRFSISESGPDGSAFAGTTNVSGNATVASSTGAGGSVSASAAVDEGATVYENSGASSGTNNTSMVLMSDWQANLESTATQNTTNPAEATDGAQAQPATGSLADFFSAAAHALFKQAVALLEGLFGVGNSNAANQAGNGNLVDEYA